MLKYFLYAIIALDLWESHAQGQHFSQLQSPVALPQPTLIDQIAAHQQQWFTYTSIKEAETQKKIDKLENLIEHQLRAVQIKMGIALQALRNLMEHTSEEYQEKSKAFQRIDKSRFEQIGSRLFYIERKTPLNWFDAYDKCRQMGGHLATFYNASEFSGVVTRFGASKFWIDIYNMASYHEFVSSLTGRVAPYSNFKTDSQYHDIK
ncbi:accessory gland protein Acp29AB [Drosophila subpulchrella]|uniref:accessory gland protein Acp29AB n=1 Tax=Drosophila subpulchrella TaxID=1486046 RepID=UPI0018A12A06|nr:accessory gland protein Acp29AB [Drosophila subpulchrella]